MMSKRLDLMILLSIIIMLLLAFKVGGFALVIIMMAFIYCAMYVMARGKKRDDR